MEKRAVGVLHELLSLTVHKKTKRNYLRSMRLSSTFPPVWPPDRFLPPPNEAREASASCLASDALLSLKKEVAIPDLPAQFQGTLHLSNFEQLHRRSKDLLASVISSSKNPHIVVVINRLLILAMQHAVQLHKEKTSPPKFNITEQPLSQP
ncbi:hypothetical protein YC2023_017185 [Brassica napus]